MTMTLEQLNQMNDQINSLIKQVETKGVECGRQSTYFGDEIYVHNYGNNERASIYSPSQFIRWANWYLNHHTEDDEYQGEDVALGGTGIQIIWSQWTFNNLSKNYVMFCPSSGQNSIPIHPWLHLLTM